MALLLALAACGEKPQTLGPRKGDQPAYIGPATAYTAPGWTPGNEASWSAELRTRAERGQNEYTRMPPR
ncbi:MAG: hypothetical protein KGJ24_10580 [Burkholderiales bacterium]|nr:hypothetical protein [Burkholderiales bacterium]